MKEIIITVEGIPITVGVHADGGVESMHFANGTNVNEYFTQDAVKFVELLVATWVAGEEQDALLERGENAAQYRNRTTVRMP